MKFPFGKILKVITKIASIILKIEEMFTQKDKEQKAKELRKKLNK